MDSFPPSFAVDPDPDGEIQWLIGEVAKRHKIVMGPQDPALAVITMLELVLGRYLERTDAMLQSQRDSVTGAMERAAAASRAAAEGLVTAAADYHVKSTRASAEEMAAALTKAAATALDKVELASRNTQRLLWFSWASIVALVAVAIGVGIGIWISPDFKAPASHCLRVTAGLSPASSGLA
jgi:hypothetical protein